MNDALDIARESKVEASHDRVAQIECDAIRAYQKRVNELVINGESHQKAEYMALTEWENRTPLVHPLTASQARIKVLEDAAKEFGKVLAWLDGQCVEWGRDFSFTDGEVKKFVVRTRDGFATFRTTNYEYFIDAVREAMRKESWK